jgi:hypothetical protein
MQFCFQLASSERRVERFHSDLTEILTWTMSMLWPWSMRDCCVMMPTARASCSGIRCDMPDGMDAALATTASANIHLGFPRGEGKGRRNDKAHPSCRRQGRRTIDPAKNVMHDVYCYCVVPRISVLFISVWTCLLSPCRSSPDRKQHFGELNT